MYARSVGSGLLAALLLALSGGCGKAAPAASPPQPETVVHLHWLGKKRLGTASNAASLMKLWRLPESARLEAQTLDKLASAPWRLRSGAHSPSSNTNYQAQALLLRPLLEDMLQEESYLEIQQAADQPGVCALAIRLDDQQAARWQTNLAAAVESLFGVRPVPAQTGSPGWSLERAGNPARIQLTRAGGWTLVGMAQTENALLRQMADRIQRNEGPCAPASANSWLEADLDPKRLATALACGWNLPADCPKLSLAMTSDGVNVLTRGSLDFPKPLPFEIQPWEIPTNVIHDPLASFTAVQGLKPWLSSLGAWKKLQAGEPPNQVYLWGQNGPFQTFLAAPLPGASNEVRQIGDFLLSTGSAWMKTNGSGTFERSTNFNGVAWAGLPFLMPFLQSLQREGELAFGGLFPGMARENPMPSELTQQLVTHTNLVYYDWEITEPRIEALTHITQLLRLVLNRAQMPPQSVSSAWLAAVAPLLGNCITTATKTAPDRLSFARNSGMGLTGLELHLLADWLESPDFPAGLHTTRTPAPSFGTHTDTKGKPKAPAAARAHR